MSHIDEAFAQKDPLPGNRGAMAVTDGPFAAGVEPLDRYPDQPGEGASVPSTLPAEEARIHRETAGVTLSDRCDGPFRAKLVVSPDASSISIEQYRRLAAALHDAQTAHGLKSLIVTSALPLDGKTLTAINLALTLSESYKRRVLLVDADLRRPSLHKAFGLSNEIGLGQVLRSRVAEPSPTDLSGTLSVLPAGRSESDPMAALTSGRMRSLLDAWEAEFEWVLLDAPPVALLPDATLLSRITQAVIFVIGAGSTPYAVVKRSIAGLGRECIVGTVLNRVDPKTIPAATYYRKYYQASDRRP